MRTLAVSLALLAFFVACQSEDVKANDQDNAILAQVLQRKYEDGGFTVVAPMTTISTLAREEPEDMAKTKKYVKDKLRVEGYDIGPLLDKLIEKNRKPVRLSLKSSPERGYLVDYDGKFQKYFEKDGGGWEKWYRENPMAHGLTRVSLPVHDEQAGIVLVYMGTQSHWLAGAGYLVAYEYGDGKLKELGRVMLWIS
jgi:hypothetical protein